MPEECKDEKKNGVWKKATTIIGGIVIVMSLATTIYTIDNRYVTVDRLVAFETTVYAQLESQRQQILTDRYYQLKSLSRQYPRDKQLAEDLKAVEKDKDESKARLDKLMTPAGVPTGKETK